MFNGISFISVNVWAELKNCAFVMTLPVIYKEGSSVLKNSSFICFGFVQFFFPSGEIVRQFIFSLL